jgi:hypothetical protein
MRLEFKSSGYGTSTGSIEGPASLLAQADIYHDHETLTIAFPADLQIVEPTPPVEEASSSGGCGCGGSSDSSEHPSDAGATWKLERDEFDSLLPTDRYLAHNTGKQFKAFIIKRGDGATPHPDLNHLFDTFEAAYGYVVALQQVLALGEKGFPGSYYAVRITDERNAQTFYETHLSWGW